MPVVHGRKLTGDQHAELYQTYLHARTIDEAGTPTFEIWIEEYEGIEAALTYILNRREQ